MKTRTLLTHSALTLSLVLSAGMLSARPQDPAQPTNPKEAAATQDNQKMSPEDQQLTEKVRKALMADKTLSVSAQNVKIVSQDGTVTLMGEVKSDDEGKAIMAKAAEVTGSPDKVVNQMSVKP
jgi:hyperosmotically inducible protein